MNMSETKKTIATIAVLIAVSVFFTTRIFLPTLKKNSELSKEFKKLKKEVGVLDSYSERKLKAFEEDLQNAIDLLGKQFLPQEDIQMTEQLTQISPSSEKITFSNIAPRKPISLEQYQIFPVDISAKASFNDMIVYLENLEKSSLLISIERLNLRRIAEEKSLLEIKMTLLGFRFTAQPSSLSESPEEQYKPFDEQMLQSLLNSIKERSRSNIALALKNFDPFLSPYKHKSGQVINEQDQNPQEKIKVNTIFDELTLKGVLLVNGNKVALINDQAVKEGERVFGVEIVAIEDYGVTIKYAGKTHILKIGVNDEIFQ